MTLLKATRYNPDADWPVTFSDEEPGRIAFSNSFHQHHVATTHVYLAHWSMAEQLKHAKSTLHSQLSHCNHNADRAKRPGILIDSLAGRQPWGSTMIFTTLLKLLL